jgi:transposase
MPNWQEKVVSQEEGEPYRQLVVKAVEDGLTIQDIEKITGLSTHTSRKWLKGPRKFYKTRAITRAAKLGEGYDDYDPDVRKLKPRKWGYLKEEGEEARQLVVKARENGFSRVQIRRITGLSIRTINRWLEGPQLFYKEDAIRRAKTLEWGAERMPKGFSHVRDRDVINRLYNAVNEMKRRGADQHEIAYISGIATDHVRRIMNTKPEDRKYVKRQTVWGIERLEAHINATGRKRRRSGYPAHPLRRPVHVARESVNGRGQR